MQPVCSCNDSFMPDSAGNESLKDVLNCITTVICRTIYNPLPMLFVPDSAGMRSGPLHSSVSILRLRAGRAVARRYRNRRIGEFLKELDLTEGRSTGIPKILQTMTTNGSDLPKFETDPDRSSFLVRLPVRTAPEEDEAQDEAQDEAHEPNEGTKSALSQHQVKTLHICLHTNSLKELIAYFSRADRTKFRNQVVNPLLKSKYLEMTRPESPTSRFQKYQTTETGKQTLQKYHD